MYRKAAPLVILVVSLVAALAAGATAGGPKATGMAGAGVALSGDVGSIFLNPAGAATIDRRMAHATINLAADAPGPQQALAYAEPDNGGYGSGILGLVRTRTATSLDAISGSTLYDSSNAWTYVVAKDLGAFSIGGRLQYETTVSEERGASGYGYRLDAGLIYRIAPGLHAGLKVDGIVSTGVHWSDHVSDPYGTVVGGGLAYVADNLQVAADVEGAAGDPDLTLRAGGAWRIAGIEVFGGIRSVGGATAWSAGGAYERGPLHLEYAYDNGVGGHVVGVTWSF